MLGRFVCPVAQLHDLDRFANLFDEAPPFAFSLLARGGKDTAEFLTNLKTDNQDLERFTGRYPHRVRTDGFEARLPHEVLSPT